MKRFRGVFVLIILIILCVGAVKLTLYFTAEFPVLGEEVSYSVNQLEGFDLSIKEPTWSPLKGYTLRYDIEINSDAIYHATEDNGPFAHLERFINGQWYRLESQIEHGYNPQSFGLGGSSHGLSGSVVQKYEGYGTRLEAGVYRLTIELTAQDGTPHYLATEFRVE